MSAEQLVVEASPVERLATGAPGEPLVPAPPDGPIELPQAAGVRRTSVVLVVTPKLRVERRGLRLDRVVPMLLAPLRYRLHTTPQAFAHGPDVNREPSPSAAHTDVREAEKIEGRGLRVVGPLREC